MTPLTVEVLEVRPAWQDHADRPTILGPIVHGPSAGVVVQATVTDAEALALLDVLAELGAMPPVALVHWADVVATDLRTCVGCGAVEDAGGPDQTADGLSPCCTEGVTR